MLHFATSSALPRDYAAPVAKVEALPYDDRTVYSVAAFNRGVGQWLSRLPTVWVEGEITELRRHERWATVFFTLKDPADGSCASFHKLRKGTVSGTLNGSTLTLRMIFPAGGDVPTPICVTDLAGNASIAGNQLTGTYSGTDSCEGLFANGQLSLTKQQ